MDDKERRLEAVPSADDDNDVRLLLEKAGLRERLAPEDLEAIASAAKVAWKREVQKRRRRLWSVAVAAAVAAVLLLLPLRRASTVIDPVPAAYVVSATGGVLIEASSIRRTVGKGDTIMAGELLQTGTSSPNASLRLTNGVIVRPGTETRLVLAGGGKLTLDRGAIYIDTAGAGKHVEVKTVVGLARDIGTRFVVRMADRSTMQVMVRDGSVAVQQGTRSHLTLAGHELLIRSDGTSSSRILPGHAAEWKWTMETSAAFPIEGRTLEEFLSWVVKQTGWNVRYANDELARSAKTIVLHGSIGDLPADRTPFVVLPTAGLTAELRDGNLTISRSP